ncbi:protein outspread [Caerostris extrusa]|uniref:Protein outspread n=1 Tax=Caerostris extrusa TaxID=172846 RepID=A0AAV4VZJ6_CAEEX|nr:protein outspread [Caerostris extrusa]
MINFFNQGLSVTVRRTGCSAQESEILETREQSPKKPTQSQRWGRQNDPTKKTPEKSTAIEATEIAANTNGSAIAAAEKLEYLESIHSKDDRSPVVGKSSPANEKEKASTVSTNSVNSTSGKTNLRKSESLKNIPSQSQSEMRDHVSGLRRYHSFKGSSSHRKVKASGASSILKKAKLSSTSSTPRTSSSTPTPVSPDVKYESPNAPLDNCQEVSHEGVFTRTGWLMRQTFSKDWSRHWFVLKDSSLTYYRDPSAEHCGIMDGILDLNQVSAIRELQPDRYYAFSLQMWDGKKHVLATETEDFRKMWMQALQYASNLWSSASKEDFICTEIVLPEHNFHHTDRISSPSSLSSLPYIYNSSTMETSSSSSDDQSEYFSLVDEDEVSDLSSSPRTLPPSPPINRNMMSIVKEKSRSRGSCGQKTCSLPNSMENSLNELNNHDTHQTVSKYDQDDIGINEEEIDELSHQLMNGDHTVSPTKLLDESLDHLSKLNENIALRLDFKDQTPERELDKQEESYGTPDLSFRKSSPCGNSDTSTSNSEVTECSTCFRIKSKLAAAKEEIRKLKKELKEAHANFDNLEMFSYKLAQDIKKTTKSDGKERKRSSLKNKEGLTLTKEYELKLCDLEKKIVNIETTVLKESSPSNVPSSRESSVPPSSDISEAPSGSPKGFFSRLQSLVSKVQNVNDLVSEKNNTVTQVENPEIRLQVKDTANPNVVDETSDDWWTVSLDKNLKKVNKYLEAHPANLSECQNTFVRKMSKILRWLRASLDNICKQGSKDISLANDKNLLVQNIIDLLTSLCSETPKDLEEPQQAKTCHALLMAYETMKLLERVDNVDSIDSLVKFDVTECAFKVIIKTLCLVFAEQENGEISAVLRLISDIPQIRFFCPFVNKLLPKTWRKMSNFQPFRNDYSY